MCIVAVNIAGIEAFKKACDTASGAMSQVIASARGEWFRLELDAEPSPPVNWQSGVDAADDYGDIGFVAEQLRLCATGADSIDIGGYQPDNGYRSPFDIRGRTRDSLITTENMANDGSAGAAARDARNSAVTVAALLAALSADADVEVTDEGLIVAQTDGLDTGIEIEVPGGGTSTITIPLNARGGTTYGNVFVVPKGTIEFDEHDNPVDQADRAGDQSETQAAILAHETRHTYQWAAVGKYQYPALYMTYEAERIANNAAADALPDDGIPIPDLPGIETFDIPPAPDPIEPGCNNPYEQDAGFEDGHYECPTP